MVDVAVEQGPAAISWSRRRETASTRDLIIAVAVFLTFAALLISIDVVEKLFSLTRDHEDWELDEVLASGPALMLVVTWYAIRRWLEAKRLNLVLAATNETLRSTHVRAIAAESQIREAQRFEALGQLAGGLAHELNNMLQPVMTLSQLSLEKDNLAPPTRANLTKILEAAEHSRDILGRALTFAGGKSLQAEEVVFADCLKDTVAFSQTVLPRTVKVEVDVPNLPELALINRTELTQIITNLMSNAARAMDGSGTLKISLTIDALSAQNAALQDLVPGRYFRLLVRDDGRGMAEDVRRRLFDPYFTTAEATNKLGLGLAVVHGIVKDWKGRITAESRLGSGTCLTILIPVAAA